MKYFVIINGTDLKTIQKETKEEAVIYAENFCDHSKEVIVREFEPKKTFYLFGESACQTLLNEGISALIEDLETGLTVLNTFCFVEGFTKSEEFINAYDGFYEFSEISEEVFNQLSDL